jgi:hypothetical protein
MRTFHGDLTRLALCLVLGAAAERGRAAEAVKIGPEQARRLPGGKEVDAIDGDYLLRSDKVVATIGGVAAFRDANVNTQAVQGAVIDLARTDLPGGDNDLLTAFYPQGHYLDAPGPTTVEVVRDRGPEVVLRFARAAAAGMQGDPVDVETEYRLRDGEPFLRIKTTYRNRGPKAAAAAIYDKIRADALFRIPPAGDAPALIYDEPWHGATYGVVRAGGAPIRSYANPARVTYFLQGGNRLDFPDLLTRDPGARPLAKTLPMPTPVPAGGAVAIERFLIPGRHPADVQAVIAALLGDAVTPVPVRVTDPSGEPVKGATVRARRGSDVLSEGRTDPEGRVILILKEAGPCDLIVNQRGRADVRAKLPAPAAGAAETTIGMGPIAQAAFDVVDTTKGRERGPVKVVLRGVDGTPDPNFGPDALPYQAGSLCFSADGRFTVAMAPGHYEAIIGRGPEFTLETRRFAVAYGATATVAAEIRRAFESPGWVIADFHNHTTASNDSIADPRGRVVGLAASGVEFAPATEHNRITTFAPYIEAEHLTAFLHSAGSIELSGRPGPGALNHHNAFPLRVREAAQGGGAPRTDRDPRVQIGRLFHHDDDAEKFVQQNHPDVGWLYFDRDRDGKIDGGFGTRPFTHAMEINRDIVGLLASLEPAVADRKRGRGFQWLQMLNQGDRIYGTANSDAHATGYHNGSIFTYLKSDVDDPARLDPRELARAAKAGRMVMSNGPFLEVSLDGVPPGGDVRLTGAARLNIRVSCPDWFDIDRVQVLVNGRPDPTLNFTRAGASAGFVAGRGALRFAREVPLALTADAHLIVVATGENSRIGPFHGTYGAQRPTAVSNPIFVDVDGGGFRANGDTLGAPLPVSSPANAPADDQAARGGAPGGRVGRM